MATANDWYAGNPPWDEIHQEWAHPNSNNGAAVIPGDHGTHEHWIVRRWESTVDGDLKCRFRFRKLNLGCGDGVIGMVCQNGSMVYSNAIAANDGIGRDDVIDLPGVRLGHKVDVVLAPGSRDYCDGSAFSAAMYLGEPTTNRWLASPRVRTHIAAGTTHSLALKADGTVVGWGGNWQGQSSIPASATNVVAVAAGNDQSVALKADGTVIGWGQATTPAGLNDVVAIASGGWHNLALKADGSVVGWGQQLRWRDKRSWHRGQCGGDFRGTQTQPGTQARRHGRRLGRGGTGNLLARTQLRPNHHSRWVEQRSGDCRGRLLQSGAQG